MTEPVRTTDVLANARMYLGTPWRAQGRDFDGIDCVGLLVCVAQMIGYEHYDLQGYDNYPTGDSLLAVLRDQFDPVHRENARAGDIMAFSVLSTGPAGHVGIRSTIGTAPSDRPGVIHADQWLGRVVEHSLGPATAKWHRRWLATFRWRGSEEG